MNAHHSNIERRPFFPTIGKKWIGNGISYGPHRDGQAPLSTSLPTREELLEDLQLLQRKWNLIRIYDSSKESEDILNVIRDHNLDVRVMLGVWIKPPSTPAKDEQNQRQIQRGIELANEFNDLVVAVNIGNETQVSWSAHRTDQNYLIEAIRTVRNGIAQPVTTADDRLFWKEAESEPVAAEVDFLVVHSYAMWGGQPLEGAVEWTISEFMEVQKRYAGMTLVMGECGWATCFNPAANQPWEQGGLIKGQPGQEEQKKFYDELMDWVDGSQTTIFFFEAFDENWKGGGDATGPYEVEKHWGLFDAQRRPKLAIQGIYPDLERAPPSLIPALT